MAATSAFLLRAVVLELGGGYTRCGFAGEATPTRTLASPAALRAAPPAAAAEERLERELHPFLRDLFLDSLLVTPTEVPVVLCESALWPSHLRHAVLSVLLRRLRVPGVACVPAEAAASLMLLPPPPHPPAAQLLAAPPPPMASAAEGHLLVVDVGYTRCRVLPVHHRQPLLHAARDVPVGLRDVHVTLRQLVLETAAAAPLPADETTAGTVWEDIAARCCFVPPAEAPAEAATVAYPFRGETLSVSGFARAHAYDALFEVAPDAPCLPRAVLDCILACPIDARVALAHNVGVIGGGSFVRGLSWRLLQELRAESTRRGEATRALAAHFDLAPSRGVPGSFAGWAGASAYAQAVDALLTPKGGLVTAAALDAEDSAQPEEEAASCT
eukprot:TRINITY_DN5279_c0_g1_i1.p1 TRINITY_DN5279_c0_g1~~TRINITY_DN5279_c0_g1_i1.p1  ORF type:complete len:393 (-),score=107.22 TRINITY_DN5279_c0_g1_i1:41-1198(-)